MPNYGDRRSDYGERQESGVDVSKNWLISALFTLTILGGGSWVASMQGQVNKVEKQQEVDRDVQQRIKSDVEVSKERLRRVEDDTKEIRQEQREQNKKLDEIRDLLRRGR